MKVVVIGAAKPGYAESITRRLISEGYSVIGTFDEEYADNAKKNAIRVFIRSVIVAAS